MKNYLTIESIPTMIKSNFNVRIRVEGADSGTSHRTDEPRLDEYS